MFSHRTSMSAIRVMARMSPSCETTKPKRARLVVAVAHHGPMPRAVLRQLRLSQQLGVGVRIAGDVNVAQQIVGAHFDAKSVHDHAPIQQHEAVDARQRGDESHGAQHFVLVLAQLALSTCAARSVA